MPPLDLISVINKLHAMIEDVQKALKTANYDNLLKSGLQVWIDMSFFMNGKIVLNKLTF